MTAPTYASREELEVARDLVLAAGKRVMSWYGRVEEESKEGLEPVTAADRDANAFLVTGLQNAFPDHGVLAEESGSEPGWREKTRRWFIDPIDGTREFISGIGEFAVMVGLADDGLPLLGLVLLPARDVLFFGGPGIGASRRDLKTGEETTLRVSDVNSIQDMTMAVSRSHRANAVDQAARKLKIGREVRSGSVGVKLGMVASAEADLYLHPASGTRLWDACAPDALVRGAGGTLTDCRGERIRYDSEDIVNRRGLMASNGRRHEEIVDLLAPIVEAEGL